MVATKVVCITHPKSTPSGSVDSTCSGTNTGTHLPLKNVLISGELPGRGVPVSNYLPWQNVCIAEAGACLAAVGRHMAAPVEPGVCTGAQSWPASPGGSAISGSATCSPR